MTTLVAVTKVCIVCKADKQETDYHRNAAKRDGLQSVCKECRQRGTDDPNARATYQRVRNGKTQTVTRVVLAHGQSRTPLYRRWKAMVQRCENPATHNYRWYGGKGVTVCAAWRTDFLAFKEWAEATGFTRDMELDRIDSTKGYSPDNCRWLTKRENVKNMRVLASPLEDALAAYCAKTGMSRQEVIEDALDAYLRAWGGGDAT